MDWSDRLVWLIVGAVLGYLIRLLQEIKREVHEVDEIVKHDRDEAGFVRFPIILDVLIVCLFVMTGYSVFRVEQTVDKANQAVAEVQAQQTADKAQDARIETIARCTLKFTADTIEALNERTTYTQDQADANVRVVGEQTRFLERLLLVPPITEAERRRELEKYVVTTREFAVVAAKNKVKVINNPYPTRKQLFTCLRLDSENKEKQDE